MMRKIILLLGFIVISFSLQAAVTILNGLTHNFTVTPGQTYSGQIQIGNTDNRPRMAIISQFDYQTNANGESSFLKPGKTGRSNISWINLSESTVRINAKDNYTVTFEVRVPNDLTGDGTYWSVIMVEPVEEADTGKLAKGQFRIENKIRYAIQVICQVGESGKIDVKFLGAEVLRENGQRVVNIDLENTGQRYVRPVIQLEFFDAEGKEAGTFQSNDQGLYPGSSLRYKVDITALPPGEYKVVALANCTVDNVFGINLTLKVKDD